jgi:hypothetical protein
MNDIRLKAGGNISEKKEKKRNKTRAKKPQGDQTRTFSFANEVDPFFMNNFFELVRGFNFSDGLVSYGYIPAEQRRHRHSST